MIRGISPDTEIIFASYDWPGEVRELRNIIERIVVLENSELIMPPHWPKEITSQDTSSQPTSKHKFTFPAQVYLSKGWKRT